MDSLCLPRRFFYSWLGTPMDQQPLCIYCIATLPKRVISFLNLTPIVFEWTFHFPFLRPTHEWNALTIYFALWKTPAFSLDFYSTRTTILGISRVPGTALPFLSTLARLLPPKCSKIESSWTQRGRLTHTRKTLLGEGHMICRVPLECITAWCLLGSTVWVLQK